MTPKPRIDSTGVPWCSYHKCPQAYLPPRAGFVPEQCRISGRSLRATDELCVPAIREMATRAGVRNCLCTRPDDPACR